MSLSQQQKVEVLSPRNAVALDTLAGVRGEMARQKSERRSSAALPWAAAFAAKYSSGLGGYKQPLRSISVNLLDALSEQRMADGLDGFQLLVARVSIRSMVPNDCPTMNAIPAIHSAERTNHSQNSPRSTRNGGSRSRIIVEYGTGF